MDTQREGIEMHGWIGRWMCGHLPIRAREQTSLYPPVMENHRGLFQVKNAKSSNCATYSRVI